MHQNHLEGSIQGFAGSQHQNFWWIDVEWVLRTASIIRSHLCVPMMLVQGSYFEDYTRYIAQFLRNEKYFSSSLKSASLDLCLHQQEYCMQLCSVSHIKHFTLNIYVIYIFTYINIGSPFFKILNNISNWNYVPSSVLHITYP